MDRAIPRFSMFLGLLLGGSAASGQTTAVGPFDPFNPWWIRPNSGGDLGVAFSGGLIRIDRDGNGSTESSYNVPTLPTGGALPMSGTNLRLSPTRQILFAFRSDSSCPSGTMVFFFNVSDPPNLTFILSECITNLSTSQVQIGRLGFYDTDLCCFNDPRPAPTGCPGVTGLSCAGRLGVSPQRIAFVADEGSPFTDRVRIHWFDLVRGIHATTFNDFHRDLGWVRTSRDGDAAFVKHDIDAGAGDTVNYTLVDLCPGAQRFGSAISSNVGGELWGRSGSDATAEVISAGGGNFAIRVTHSELVGGQRDFPFSPCGMPPPPATGACCLPNGNCVPEQTLAQCNGLDGVWLGPESVCADCPPPVGGCCVGGVCWPTQIGQGECQQRGGTWLGSGVACTTANCFPVGGCCINGACWPAQIGQNECQQRGGTWLGTGVACTSSNCFPLGGCCVSGACTSDIWAPLGGRLNHWVYALTVHNGELIAAGYTIPSRCDGTQWRPLGSGVFL